MGLGRLLKSSRALLWVGFGGLLAIVLLMAWEGSRVVGVIEGEGNRLRATYQQRDELLDGIRFALSESASDIRDYLADRNVSAVAQRRIDLQKLRSRIADAVARYGRDLPPDESGLIVAADTGHRSLLECTGAFVPLGHTDPPAEGRGLSE